MEKKTQSKKPLAMGRGAYVPPPHLVVNVKSSGRLLKGVVLRFEYVQPFLCDELFALRLSGIAHEKNNALQSVDVRK